MSESEPSGRVTAYFHDDSLELRSKVSPEAWIVCDDPATVER